MKLPIRHYIPLFAGALSLAIAVLSFARSQLMPAAVAAAAFGVILLALVAHTLVRVGHNYRQLRSDHQELRQQLRDIGNLLRETREIAGTTRIDEDQLLNVMDRMTPIITQTVARDWSINANRIAARYELLEAELRELLHEFEDGAAERQDRPPRQDVAGHNARPRGDRSRLGD